MITLLKRLFAKKEQSLQKNQSGSSVRSTECTEIQELNQVLRNLLLKNHYVARSEYLGTTRKYQRVIEYFTVLESSGMLDSFCVLNGADITVIRETIEIFRSISDKVDQANDEYMERALITEKDYLDEVLRAVDPVISLDEDQRRAVLTDEDYCLVIAGAGAGKTTTVAAKVKYLVDRKNIDPKDILVISFTNKAVGELREKINKDLRIDCPIATFHSTGNAILHIHNPEQLNIIDNSKLYFLLQDYFKDSILTNEGLVNNLILFFASYFDAPYEGTDLNEFFNKTAKANYTTMRSDLEEFRREIVDNRTKKKVTIQNEVLRSCQEVEIANFLYLNNIDYEYEPLYPYNISYSRKPYTPDFIIRQGDLTAYLEHFGVTEAGENDRFSEDELTRYKHCVNDKVRLHREHRTRLIYTFSGYRDRKSITSHLKEQLEDAGFILVPKSNKEIMEKLISSEESRYIRRLVSLICRFIANFKTNGYTVEEFGRMYHSTTNVRSRLFLNICEDCFREYERYLKVNRVVDFEDMINDSARVLREVKEMKQRLHFKYIIVDEYQDISRQRFDLTTALAEVTDGKIIAVGDDWQSIYAFSGSDISLFTKFQEKMGYARLLKIVRTYRNSQDVIDIAGNFIQKNPEQIEKNLISPKHIENPVIIYTYDNSFKKDKDDRRTGRMYATAHAVEIALEQIMAYDRETGREKHGSVLLLGRYGFDGDHLERSGLFEFKARESKLKSVKYPKLDITFMTVHMSKGLGYDNVIVVNGKNETYGFPSKMEDDPVLSFVIKGDNSIDYAEERRLFYVAMTRTKNRVYFIAPEQNPSEFLLEIKNDYKNVVLKGSWNEEQIKHNMVRKSCPVCGYPMQLRYKNSYGLRLYLCTNEPEICGFMTNELKAGKLAVMKCDRCRDGYLIVKSTGGNGYFLGCTNYQQNKTGCNNSISSADYYTMMNFTQEPAASASRIRAYDNKHRNVMRGSDPDITDHMTASKVRNENASTASSSIYTSKKEDPKITYMGFDLYEVTSSVLQCLEHISEHRYYGISILIATLQGGNHKQRLKDNLNLVPEYGMYAEMKRSDLRAVVQWLLDRHYMLRTKQYYPVLHPTHEGRHFTETVTPGSLRNLKRYLEDPKREIFEDEIQEEDMEVKE